jgi:hypothetical protein
LLKPLFSICCFSLFIARNSYLVVTLSSKTNFTFPAKGAKQWMKYMKESLKENQHHFKMDSRILPSIVDFLETKMKAYALFHEWTFDSSDFNLADFESSDDEVLRSETSRRD